MSGPASRILVVDDEPGIRRGCQRALAAEGYEVNTAADGAAALEVFRAAGDFALALVDLKMPGIGGMELIPRLRELDDHLVVVVITAYATIDTAVEATKRGAYAYLPKPFTPDELLVPVRNGLERRALSLETARLRAERERQLLEVAYERSKCGTIINCMTDGVLVVNRDRQVVLRNAASARITDRWDGLRVPAELDALECPGLAAVVEEVLAAPRGPMIVSREVEIRGSVYMANVSPVAEPGGADVGAVAVLRDITALKRLEAAKSMFVSMVAHEVRSPVAAVETNINLILGGYTEGDRPRERELLTRCVVRTAALRQMVSELMNLTAIETGNFVLTRTRLDLAEVVEEAAASCVEAATAKGIEVVLNGISGGGRIEVLGDHAALLSVFSNLIGNAVKYTLDGGHVCVSVSTDGCCARVAVADDGIGMSPEECAHCFDEFFRARNQHTAGIPGTGLGLTLCRRLLEMHDGRIQVRSEPGKGSTFTVSLMTGDAGGGGEQ